MSIVIARLHEGRRQRIVAFGTSLTSEWNWRLWRNCGGHWVRMLRERLTTRFDGLAYVTNAARWGADSSWAARRIRRIARSGAIDAVLVEFAINDAEVRRNISLVDFHRNLVEVLDVLRTSSPDCEVYLLVTNPVFGRHARGRPRLQDYYDVVRSLAREQGVGLIDTAPAWQVALTQKSWRAWIPDGIHPGEEGAREITLPQVQRALGLDM
jgi:lysophospholipase L1-like esterase